jgi:hypothetical protein
MASRTEPTTEPQGSNQSVEEKVEEIMRQIYVPPIPPGTRVYADLLRRALEERQTELFETVGCTQMQIVNMNIAELSGKYHTREFNSFCRNVARNRRMTEKNSQNHVKNVLANMFIEGFSRLVLLNGQPHFNIMGCPRSTDIDVLVVVDDTRKPVLPNDFRLVVRRLIEAGYEVDRGLDINFVSWNDNGSFDGSAGNESIRIAVNTYGCHRQVCPPIVSNPELLEPIDFWNKIYGFRNFITKLDEGLYGVEEHDRIRNFNGEQMSLRDIKRKFFQSNGFEIFDMCNIVVQLILQYSSMEKKFSDFWKTFALKTSQIILFEHGLYSSDVYQKEKLASLFDQHFPEHHGKLRLLLLREVSTPEQFPESLVQFLIGQYMIIARRHHSLRNS